MGYTHYYRQKRDMTPEEFEGFAQDVKALAAALPKTSGEFDAMFAQGGYATGARGDTPMEVAYDRDDLDHPIVGEDWVHFNGAGYDDADHETFRVERVIDKEHWCYKEGEALFQFTKTARKPYDAMVCACLLALARRAPSAWEMSSDGEARNWVGPARFARSVLGKQMPLGKVKNFSSQKTDLAAARELSPMELARKEAAAIDRVTKKAKASKPRPAL